MKYIERLSDNKGFVLRCNVGVLARGDTIESFVDDIFRNAEADNIYTGIPSEDTQQGLTAQEHTLFWEIYKGKQEQYRKYS